MLVGRWYGLANTQQPRAYPVCGAVRGRPPLMVAYLLQGQIYYVAYMDVRIHVVVYSIVGDMCSNIYLILLHGCTYRTVVSSTLLMWSW